ncbi:MAG: DNA replication protein, partial [Alphaproteobacteria bacterium]
MAPVQLPLDLGFRPAMGAADFMVADSNGAAVGWLDRWPDWPAPALVVHGPAGCGKSHLTQVWRARTGARALAMADLSAADLPAVLGAAGEVAVDDAERVAGAGQERALLHLYNLVNEAGGHLLLTGRAPPARWRLGLADLASRLRAAPAVAVGEPDDALLAAVLVKLFADRQLRVGDEVLRFLLLRMERSFAAARRLVAALDDHSLAASRPV